MLIRKKYKFEAAHIVRNCASTRCSQNVHGHSFIVEVIFHSDFLDDGDMVIDFGLLKETVGELIDWFDHSLLVWLGDEDLLPLARTLNERICFLPYNTTAENLSKIFFMSVNTLLDHSVFQNGETGVSVDAVRVHETATGYAECSYEDISTEDWKRYKGISFSHVLKNNRLFRVFFYEDKWINPEEV